MRDDQINRSLEIGTVIYSPCLKRTRQATEAQYLLMRYVFYELGYRRYEWKCDNYNEASKRAALRLGFTYEGLFRQALIYKGRTRDTAWFAMIDQDWKKNKARLEAYLSSANFDEKGRQYQSLSADLNNKL